MGSTPKQIKKLYYSIGEVSKLTKLKPYVLRYWETEFKKLSPPKNRAGNRTYRQEDIEIDKKITVYSQAYTIKGRIRGEGKKFYFLVNGQATQVKTNGEFEFDRFNVNPDNIEDLRLVVVDQWNKRSEKNVRVTIKIDQIFKPQPNTNCRQSPD